MKIVILSTLGALILIGVGVYLVFHLSDRIKVENKTFFRLEDRWFYGFLGYTSVIATIFIVLVLQTSLTRQEQTLESTQERFQEELSAFRDRLGNQTDRLMSQINEKAALTGSEVEVRGNLANEREQHRHTKGELEVAREELRISADDLNWETMAHRAYLDSLNTKKAVHASTQNRLDRETQQHTKTQETLRNTRRDLNKANERLNVQNRQVKDLKDSLKRAQENAKKAQQIADAAAKRLLQKADEHQQGLILLQATADSLFKKSYKHPRVPEPVPQKN
jgi:chromosome segregation ATPase